MSSELLEPQILTPRAGSGRAKFAIIELLPPILLGLTLAMLIARCWRKSLDPIIDFGREFYTPWQLASGKTLYTDIAAFYGPLSQYANALAFKLFGASLGTLMTFNIFILALATALLYLLLRQVTSMLAATVGGALFIILFATAHVGAVGNFNFLTPYSHEATHGFTLSLAALCAFTRYSRTHRTRWLALMAFVAGCVVMTKPEITLALAGALAAGFALGVRNTGFTPYRVVIAAAAFLLPLVLMTLFLATRSPLPDAVKHTLGAYLFVSNGELLSSRFYANSMGLENPGGQIALIFITAARYAAVLVPALIAAFFVKNRILGAVAGFLLALVAGALLGLQWWMHASEILLLSTVIIAIFQLPALRQIQRIPHLTLTAFSVLILLKMLLHTRFHQYGFILAIMPTMLLVIALLDQVPAWLQSRGANPWAFRAPALGVLAMLAVVSLTVSQRNLAGKQELVAAGADSFYTDDRAKVINETLAWLRQNTRPDQTVTVLPEGLMLNAVAKRSSSIPYLSALPSDITMFSEQRILEALQKNPPAFIAITHREASDFGQTRFGADYALTLRHWIMQNYRPVHLSGQIPYSSEHFGIFILRRNR